MKCIYCSHDSKYKDRTNGKCSQCHKKFAFEPKNGNPYTDPAFKAAIDAVSAMGQIRWGVEHLAYELARRRKAFGPGSVVVAGFLVGGLLLLLGGAVHPIVAALAALPVVRFVHTRGLGNLLRHGFGRPALVNPNDAQFNALWDRWIAAHGSPPGLIVRKPQAKVPKAQESDIGDYSFDRAVICDRARTVDLLIANNFHFENNCAVLSVGGYPEGPFETVRAMLKRNPKLQVFVLHDATVAGCQLAYRLTHDPQWFKDHPFVTDVGLRPRHAKPFQSLWLPNPGVRQTTPGQGIDADEAAWLNDHVLELAAIRPEQVLKRLFRAINGKEESATSGGGDGGIVGDGGGVYFDNRSFSSNASDSDGGADSFG